MSTAHKLTFITSYEDIERQVLKIAKDFRDGKIQASDLDHNDAVRLFNPDRHTLFEHQVDAVRAAINHIVLSPIKHSGYCFMPTSGGKSYIIITLAALAVGDFRLFRIVDDAMPGFFSEYPEVFPFFVNMSFAYSRMIPLTSVSRTQVLVHDIEILKQLRLDTGERLPKDLAERVGFFSIQSHHNGVRRESLKYLIIDECHWGNASPEESLQSELVAEIKAKSGKAFGFTASPYENPEGKFQRTWSLNKINSDRDFNYYLDRDIIYPITLREVNLQNARLDYELGGEEIELTEKSQVVDFIANHIVSTLPRKLDFPAICFFSPVIIPDIVRELINKPDVGAYLKTVIRILGTNEAQFIDKCRSQFGEELIATEDTIKGVIKGDPIFLISQQKLLVGLNAPLLKYCFISPTNSKIKILQGIGRLMRPSAKVDRKLAVLFLTSLSGKKMDIGEGGNKEGTEHEPCVDCNRKICDCACDECNLPRNSECECPKASYTTTSMTLSEAYDLPIKVFYKTEVGFRDFINQARVNDTNTVLRIGTLKVSKDEFDKWNPIQDRSTVGRVRQLCFVAYRNDVLKRDKNTCQGKKLLGEQGCSRSMGEVELNIHHLPPYEFASLLRTLGEEKTVSWHASPDNWQYLVTLCKSCHQLAHKAHKTSDEDDFSEVE